jgi:transketolase
MADTTRVNGLRALSARLRLSMIKVHQRAGAGHLGSSLSIAEILAVVFLEHFRWRGEDEEPWRGDRFVLSKGHAALALYCVLEALGRLDPAELVTFGRNGSRLEPHPNESLVPGVHASTGSLGQGLSIGLGMALGSRLRRASDRSFVVIGDGEANEGQIWEAARCAAALRLDNLIVILDDNRMQQDGATDSIMPVPDLVTCWEAMGWSCLECDGHNCGEIAAALDELTGRTAEAPRLLRCHTVKGRGIDFLEGRTESHYPPPLADDDISLVQYAIDRELHHG